MKVRIVSDIHAEFSNGNFDFPVMDDEANTVLLLAGDLGVAERSVSYVWLLDEFCKRFRAVMFIPGNHEHYKSSLHRTVEKMRRSLLTELNALPGNLYFDDMYAVTIDNVRFICATLWTNMNDNDPACMMGAQGMINDYRMIRNGPIDEPYKSKLRVVDTIYEFNRQRDFIFEELTKADAEGLTSVVMTHHAPSFQSIAPHYVNNLSGAYASELYPQYGDQVMPVVHVHGHVHDSFDYMLDRTRILCNPRGYWRDNLNPNFNPELVVEI